MQHDTPPNTTSSSFWSRKKPIIGTIVGTMILPVVGSIIGALVGSRLDSEKAKNEQRKAQQDQASTQFDTATPKQKGHAAGIKAQADIRATDKPRHGALWGAILGAVVPFIGSAIGAIMGRYVDVRAKEAIKTQALQQANEARLSHHAPEITPVTTKHDVPLSKEIKRRKVKPVTLTELAEREATNSTITR